MTDVAVLAAETAITTGESPLFPTCKGAGRSPNEARVSEMTPLERRGLRAGKNRDSMMRGCLAMAPKPWLNRVMAAAV